MVLNKNVQLQSILLLNAFWLRKLPIITVDFPIRNTILFFIGAWLWPKVQTLQTQWEAYLRSQALHSFSPSVNQQTGFVDLLGGVLDLLERREKHVHRCVRAWQVTDVTRGAIVSHS